MPFHVNCCLDDCVNNIELKCGIKDRSNLMTAAGHNRQCKFYRNKFSSKAKAPLAKGEKPELLQKNSDAVKIQADYKHYEIRRHYDRSYSVVDKLTGARLDAKPTFIKILTDLKHNPVEMKGKGTRPLGNAVIRLLRGPACL